MDLKNIGMIITNLSRTNFGLAAGADAGGHTTERVMDAITGGRLCTLIYSERV